VTFEATGHIEIIPSFAQSKPTGKSPGKNANSGIKYESDSLMQTIEIKKAL
jgi:hypothetical protein